jgi:hypothetical protein
VKLVDAASVLASRRLLQLDEVVQTGCGQQRESQGQFRLLSNLFLWPS